MKANDFASAARALAKGFRSGENANSTVLENFAKVFDGTPSQTLGKRLEQLRRNTWVQDGERPNLGDVDQTISPLFEIINLVGNATAKSECENVQSLLRAQKSVSLQKFLAHATEGPKAGKTRSARGSAPIRQDLVDRYLAPLKSGMIDGAQFTSIFEQLKEDNDLTVKELSELAKTLTGTGAKSRDAALNKLLKKHQSHMVQLKRAQAVKGRSAA